MYLKKISLLLIIFFIPIIVKAQTFYGEYYESENTESIEEDQIKIIENKKYNTFNISYVDMGYLEDNLLYLKDENDYIIKPTNMITINTYVDKVRNILMNFSDKYKIYEIEIYNKGELLDYNIDSRNLKNDIIYVNDGNYNTYYTHSNRNILVPIYFFDTYDIDDLMIKLYIKNDNNMNIAIDVGIYANLELDYELDNPYIIKLAHDSINALKIEYEVIDKVLYKYYDIKKEITNEYKVEGDNLILDDYIVENKMFKRDKLILSDDIIITNNDYNIEDYILYKSGDVLYDCNINTSINGSYYCNFTLNDIDVVKEVLVNIADNDSSVFENTDNNDLVDEKEIKEVENNSNGIKETKSEKLRITKNEVEDLDVDDLIVDNSVLKDETDEKYEESNDEDRKISNEKLDVDNSITEHEDKTNVIDNNKNKTNKNKKNFKKYILVLISTMCIVIVIFMKRRFKNVESI